MANIRKIRITGAPVVSVAGNRYLWKHEYEVGEKSGLAHADAQNLVLAKLAEVIEYEPEVDPHAALRCPHGCDEGKPFAHPGALKGHIRYKHPEDATDAVDGE